MILKDFNRILSHRNTVRINSVSLGNNESVEHKILKMRIVEMLITFEQPFYTECVFENGRGDVVAPLIDTVFEVLISEKDENIKAKECYYPEGFKIVRIKCFADVIEWATRNGVAVLDEYLKVIKELENFDGS